MGNNTTKKLEQLNSKLDVEIEKGDKELLKNYELLSQDEVKFEDYYNR